MAVMTTQQPEGVAVEQKIQPVPSSDKMALDLDINGTSSRDETSPNPTSSDIAITKPLEDSSDAVSSKVLEVNGTTNDDAFSANQAIPTPPTEPAPESQRVEETSPSAPNSFLDTNTTTTEVQKLSISPDDAHQSGPEAILTSADSAIDTAMEDVAAASSVLPVIDTQESDVRNSELSPPPAAQPIPEETSPDLIFGDEPAQDLFSETYLQPGAGASSVAQPIDPTFETTLPDLPQIPTSDVPTQEVAEDTEMTTSAPITPKQSAPAENNLSVQPPVDDTPMHSSPLNEAAEQAQPAKIAREREEDDGGGQPSAKRTKTEEVDGSDAGLAMAEPYQNGDTATPAADAKKDAERGEEPMTAHEAKEYIKVIRNATRTKNGGFLKAPVVELVPNLREQYLALIEQPIDLGTMETKLKERKYANLNALRADINLLWSNSVKFNGDAHGVTTAAREVRNSLLHKVRNIPAEKLPAPKKEKKNNKGTPTPDAAPRAATMRKPKVPAPRPATQAPAQPAPTFALDPVTNTPLIRRDSTNDNERPHRKIQRPVKDLPYTASKPKNKKLATELKFCGEVLNEMKHKRHHAYSMPFMEPVDPVALNIPNYFTMIKTPMDIKTVTNRLNNGMYANAKDFEKDVRLIFVNCFKFNPVGNPVNDMGKSFLDVFNKEWDKKSDWIAEHSPPAASPSFKSESDEEESEEEEDEHDEAAGSAGPNTAAANRLIEEQKKLIQMMQKKPLNPMDVSIQQAVVDSVQKIIDDSANTKKPKKTKAPKPKKPAAVKKEKPAPKKPAKKKKEHLDYMGTVEKEVISNGLSSLPEEIANNVLDMIKADQAGVDIGDDGTLELDIDVVSPPVLWQIHALIMKHAPEVDAQVRAQFAETNAPRTLAKPAPKKKNKPMNAAEQEAKIEALKNGLGEFDRQGSGSQEPIMQTVEKQDPESSGDESDSEEE